MERLEKLRVYFFKFLEQITESEELKKIVENITEPHQLLAEARHSGYHFHDLSELADGADAFKYRNQAKCTINEEKIALKAFNIIPKSILEELEDRKWFSSITIINNNKRLQKIEENFHILLLKIIEDKYFKEEVKNMNRASTLFQKCGVVNGFKFNDLSELADGVNLFEAKLSQYEEIEVEAFNIIPKNILDQLKKREWLKKEGSSDISAEKLAQF